MNTNIDVKRFIPIKYNRFYWWRRFKARTMLHKNFPLLDRIKNGDLDYSDYYIQAVHELELAEKTASSFPPYAYTERDEALKMGRMRYNRLMVDFDKEEVNILHQIKTEFCKWFWISEEEYYIYVEQCIGGLEDLYELIKLNTLYKFTGTNRNNY